MALVAIHPPTPTPRSGRTQTQQRVPSEMRAYVGAPQFRRDLDPVKVGAEWQIVFQIRNLAATYDAWGSERGAAPASTEEIRRLKIIGGPIRVKYSVEPGELQGTG